MDTSDDGIHAASIGGIWKSAIFGFAGIRLVDGKLHINPRIPKHWQDMTFTIQWRGQPVTVVITPSILTVNVANNEQIEFETDGTVYSV